MLNYLWKLTAVVTQAGTILGMTDQDLSAGIEEVLAGSANNVDNDFVAIAEQKPMVTFSTTDLTNALTICGLDGYSLGGATDFYFARYANNGVVDTTSVHLKVSFTQGMMIPVSLDASQGKQAAKLTYEIHPTSSNGTTAPFTVTASSALPSFGQNSALFTLGPVGVNSGAITGAQSVKWNFGIKPEILGADGEVYPTFAAICERQTHCAINGADLTAIATFGLGGTALTTFKTFFRKMARASVRVADATAQHIKLSGTQGMLYPRGVKGSNGKPFEGEWNIVPTFDGTNNTTALSTASAVS